MTLLQDLRRWEELVSGGRSCYATANTYKSTKAVTNKLQHKPLFVSVLSSGMLWHVCGPVIASGNPCVLMGYTAEDAIAKYILTKQFQSHESSPAFKKHLRLLGLLPSS